MNVPALLAAVAAPRRREILRLLWQGERAAGDIRRAMPDVTFGAVSQHLRVLTASGALTVRPQGRFRFYAAHKQSLGALCPWLEEMWDDALLRLRVRAELEEARRGPRPRRRSRRGGSSHSPAPPPRPSRPRQHASPKEKHHA
jgi:DNA-binding transcriptional ArsR family regulator